MDINDINKGGLPSEEELQRIANAIFAEQPAPPIGISPSVLENEGDNLFSIEDPITSLPDPHFEDGKIPASVAGSGISPSVLKKESVPSFHSDIHKVLNDIISFIPSSQLPIEIPGIHEGGVLFSHRRDKNKINVGNCKASV
ncbi:MAG: hypothetical protein WDO14_06600 [Bacteroidota bacterium]